MPTREVEESAAVHQLCLWFSPHVGQLGKLSRSWNFSADATAPTSFHDLAPLHVAARIDQQAKLSPCEIPSRDVRLEVDQKMMIDHRGRP